jgi:hypothetical protein
MADRTCAEPGCPTRLAAAHLGRLCYVHQSIRADVAFASRRRAAIAAAATGSLDPRVCESCGVELNSRGSIKICAGCKGRA